MIFTLVCLSTGILSLSQFDFHMLKVDFEKFIFETYAKSLYLKLMQKVIKLHLKGIKINIKRVELYYMTEDRLGHGLVNV